MRVGFLAVALVAACAASSRPMTGSCETAADCQDPSLPYCVGGTCGACDGPMTCTIDLPRCEPDTLTCGACLGDGDCTLYAMTPHCGNGRCVGCVSSAQCANPAPICDAMTEVCRGCQTDSECPSQVCDIDHGTCTSSDTIVYAADNAPDTAPCTQAAPCSLNKAIGSVTFSKPTLRMLPGIYSQAVSIGSTTAMTIVATGAGLVVPTPVTGLEVRDGANVTIRGLNMNIGGQAIYCHAATGVSTLTMRQVTVQSVGYGIASQACNLTLSQVTLPTGLNPAGANTTATIDRSLLYVRADAGGAAGGGGISITVTNSIVWSLDFSRAENASIHASYSTFTSPEDCTVPPTSTPSVLFDEDIFYAPGAANAISGTSCTFQHDLAFPQTIALGTATITADPKFVDPAHGDYHLQAGSPAIDVAPAGAPDTHDFDGTPRPKGAANDLGAFERGP